MDSELQGLTCSELKPVKSMIRSWTVDEDSKLRHYVLEQLTRAEMSVRLNRSKAAIGRRAYKLGLTKQKGQAAAIAVKMEGVLRAKSKVVAPWMEGQPVPGKPLTIHTPKRDHYSCTMEGLTRTTCRWPCGEPASPDFFYCGRPTFEKSVYCLGHCKRAYGGFSIKI